MKLARPHEMRMLRQFLLDLVQPEVAEELPAVARREHRLFTPQVGAGGDITNVLQV